MSRHAWSMLDGAHCDPKVSPDAMRWSPVPLPDGGLHDLAMASTELHIARLEAEFRETLFEVAATVLTPVLIAVGAVIARWNRWTQGRRADG